MKLISGVPNVDPATGNQDVGVMRDDITPGDGTGTPHREDHYNDVYYGQRAIMFLAGLTPDNSVEGVTASQAADAIKYINNGVLFQRFNRATSYTILDTDFYRTIYVDTTAGDVTITMPLLANNIARRIRIIHAKGGTNKVIIAPNAADANTLTSDALAVIWLPKVNDFIDFENNDTVGAVLWQSINERITSQLRLNTYAGFGSSDTKIMQFTNSVEDIGNAFSHNHGSYGTDGLEITINISGKYGFSFMSTTPAAGNGQVGFSLNSTQLTTNLGTITIADQLPWTYIETDGIASAAWSGRLESGDVIRFHTDGGIPNLTQFVLASASYLGN